MKATFVELPAFNRFRPHYLNDQSFRELQTSLMRQPTAGPVIEGTGGLRKLRHSDEQRGKGKRGGLRIIYYWWDTGSQFWLFTLYHNAEMSTLSNEDKKALKAMLKTELEIRR